MTTNSDIQRWRSAAITAVIAVGTLLSAGCSLSDAGLTAYRPPDQYFAVLALEHHAINLSTVAPYDTLTLHTIRTMGDGSDVPGEVTYSVNNPGIRVTKGVLTAVSAVDSAVVRVTLTYGTITRTDSAVVSVIATAPTPLHTFGLRVPADDSAKTAVGVLKTIPFISTSASGATPSPLLVSLVSSDTMTAAVARSGNTVSLNPRRPGRVVLSTSTFAYGAVWRDSLVFTVGWPIVYYPGVVERFATGSAVTVLDFASRDFTIGAGGCVIWTNMSIAADIDIQFDDPSHAGASGSPACPGNVRQLHADLVGNIAPFRVVPLPPRFLEDGFWDTATEEDVQIYLASVFSPYRARTFSTPGVYPYRSVLHGTTGIIRVCDERNDTTCAPVRIGNWN